MDTELLPQIELDVEKTVDPSPVADELADMHAFLEALKAAWPHFDNKRLINFKIELGGGMNWPVVTTQRYLRADELDGFMRTIEQFSLKRLSPLTEGTEVKVV